MAFGIIRVREISAGEVGATDIHNGRKYEEYEIEAPDNLDGTDNHHTCYIGSDGFERENCNLKDVIDDRIKEAGCQVKKNSVVALEFVVSASKEFFEKYSDSGHFGNCLTWLENRYGRKNVVAMYTHNDETTPHAHFIVVPVVEKKVRWKNQKGEGEKIENRLCARDLTGNKEKLEKLQDDYFTFIKKYGDSCGVPFYRGTKASNQLKEYTKKTDHTLGQLRNVMEALDSKITEIDERLKKGEISDFKALEEKTGINTRIEQAKLNSDEITKELQRLKLEAANKEARRAKYNADGKWKKGLDFKI